MRILAPIALLAALLVALAWTDRTPADADFVFVNQNEVFTLDPQRMSYVQDLRLAYALYEGLVRWNNEDFSIVPAVALDWQRDASGTLWTFRLRDDARWSNGEPVVAEDFILSWRRALLPDTAADYSTMFFAIAGGEAFFLWRAEQLARYAADPWSDPDSATPREVALAVARLEALAAAGDLPESIARPAAGAVGPTRAELAALRVAAESGGATMRLELREARRAAAWHAALGAPASREAEVEWMWRRAEARFAETVGLAAPDTRTLVVRLERPVAYLLDLFAFGVFAPVHRPTVEGWPEGRRAEPEPPMAQRRWVRLDPRSGRLEQRHEWARPGTHVGNGPYVLAQWRYKRDLRLERSPTWRAPEMLRNDSVLALTIEDVNTAVLAYSSGRIDWLADVDTDYQADMIEERRAYERRHAARIEELRAEGLDEDAILAALPAPERGERRDIHLFPTFGTDFYSFNCRPRLNDGRVNPFADPRVRRAFSMAVDKEIIVERVTRLRERVLETFIPPGSIPGYRSPAGLPEDVDAARAELAEAGWEDRDGDGFVEDAAGTPFPSVDLLYTTNVPRYKWISLELQSQWESRLGVSVELRPAETKFYKDDLKQGAFMIARGRWYGDYGDPTTFLDLCRSDDGNNDRRYASDEVDAMLDAAARETDPDARMRLLEECEATILRDAPLLPICQLAEVSMYEPGRVRGLSAHPRLTQYLWKLEVDER